MKNYNINLKERYSKMSDDQLLNIVYHEKDDYTEEAINLAKIILEERGLSQPSEEVLKKAKEYRDTPDVFQRKKLKTAVKEKDYLFIGKYLFWAVVSFAIYSIYLMGLPYSTNMREAVQETGSSAWLIYFSEFFFTIAIFGIIPVLFFIVYSLRLSKEKRREKSLSLLMPWYVFFIYGISLIIFFFFMLG